MSVEERVFCPDFQEAYASYLASPPYGVLDWGAVVHP